MVSYIFPGKNTRPKYRRLQPCKSSNVRWCGFIDNNTKSFSSKTVIYVESSEDREDREDSEGRDNIEESQSEKVAFPLDALVACFAVVAAPSPNADSPSFEVPDCSLLAPN